MWELAENAVPQIGDLVLRDPYCNLKHDMGTRIAWPFKDNFLSLTTLTAVELWTMLVPGRSTSRIIRVLPQILLL